mmetsp:Transcript_7555/g.12700  ORF Transcript_7555/g.12700 Transcript_7555/m.12700 type:complete len:170 (-) Transcript_7555:196-705(-)
MSRKKTDREIEIEQQIAHLQWLKNQNERSYQKTMQKTRVIQQNDQILKIAVDKNNEKFVRMKNVIKDELSKPLVLTDAESYELEKQKLKRHEYFEKTAATHERVITKLSKQFSHKIENNQNTAKFLAEPLYNCDMLLDAVHEKQKKQIRPNPHTTMKRADVGRDFYSTK